MSVYYLGNQFPMNLRVKKPCVVIKGTKWLKNIVSIQEQPRADAPEYQEYII
jgi:hypothetical protein